MTFYSVRMLDKDYFPNNFLKFNINVDFTHSIIQFLEFSNKPKHMVTMTRTNYFWKRFQHISKQPTLKCCCSLLLTLKIWCSYSSACYKETPKIYWVTTNIEKEKTTPSTEDNAHLQRFAVGWIKSYNIAFAVFASVFIIFCLLLIS